MTIEWQRDWTQPSAQGSKYTEWSFLWPAKRTYDICILLAYHRVRKEYWVCDSIAGSEVEALGLGPYPTEEAAKAVVELNK